MTTDVEAVTTANQELYTAFELADLDRMAAVWDDTDDVRCVHPGWPPLVGRKQVLRSWSVLFANTAYIQFFLTDVHATVDGDLAIVNCEENILTAVDEDDSVGEIGGLHGNQRATATNVFRRRPQGWRLWLHHASPVLAADGPHGD